MEEEFQEEFSDQFHDQFEDQPIEQPIEQPEPQPMPVPPQIYQRKKRIICCIPGDTFSKHFLLGWTEVLTRIFIENKYQLIVSNEYDSHANLARGRCLGGNVLFGPDQTPFQGSTDYDALLWLDPDIVFNYDMIIQLIENCLNNFPVVSGVYTLDGGKELCCVKDWDMDYYRTHGKFNYLTIEESNQLIQSGNPCIICGYVGMGCMAIRKGVIEDSRLKYPWFFCDIKKIATGNPNVPYLTYGTSEDVSFIRNLIENGIIEGVVVNLKLRFGREKTIVL
jgi:hypothetical protein